MATVFVDMLGFFVVLPLLPFYAERLGADPFIIGALVSTFAFAQLTTAPLWGKLSDRYGRRPAILGGLALAAVAYVVFGIAESVWMLFLSRLVQGRGRRDGGRCAGLCQRYGVAQGSSQGARLADCRGQRRGDPGPGAGIPGDRSGLRGTRFHGGRSVCAQRTVRLEVVTGVVGSPVASSTTRPVSVAPSAGQCSRCCTGPEVRSAR